MVATLSDPFGAGHMGIATENLAEKWAIFREEQDAFAAKSHRRAALAIEEGRFKSQIVPIIIKSRKGDSIIDTDEHVNLAPPQKVCRQCGLPLRKMGP